MKISKTGKNNQAKLMLSLTAAEFDRLGLCKLTAEVINRIDPDKEIETFALQVKESKFGVSSSRPSESGTITYTFPVDKVEGVIVHSMPDFGATTCMVVDHTPGSVLFALPDRSSLKQYRPKQLGPRYIGFTKAAEHAARLADELEEALNQMGQSYYRDTGKRADFNFRHNGTKRPVIYSPEIPYKTY